MKGKVEERRLDRTVRRDVFRLGLERFCTRLRFYRILCLTNRLCNVGFETLFGLKGSLCIRLGIGCRRLLRVVRGREGEGW